MIKVFKLKEERGFSLVELMIVVAIIAILAAIAIPAFMRFAMKSKTSEAMGNLSSIRTTQEAYRAEEDVYLVCLENPGGNPTSKQRAWVTGNGDFDLTGFAPDGMVRYTYIVLLGTIGTTPTFGAQARGDLDDDLAFATFNVVKGEGTYPKPEKNLLSTAVGALTVGTGEW